MLKLQHFFILVSFLVVTSLVACEKDEESPEPQGGSQVSGGQVQGESSEGGSEEPQDDMGLQGGEAAGGQSAGSDLDQEQLSGGAPSDLPVEGGVQESEDSAQEDEASSEQSEG